MTFMWEKNLKNAHFFQKKAILYEIPLENYLVNFQKMTKNRVSYGFYVGEKMTNFSFFVIFCQKKVISYETPLQKLACKLPK